MLEQERKMLAVQVTALERQVEVNGLNADEEAHLRVYLDGLNKKIDNLHKNKVDEKVGKAVAFYCDEALKAPMAKLTDKSTDIEMVRYCQGQIIALQNMREMTSGSSDKIKAELVSYRNRMKKILTRSQSA